MKTKTGILLAGLISVLCCSPHAYLHAAAAVAECMLQDGSPFQGIGAKLPGLRRQGSPGLVSNLPVSQDLSVWLMGNGDEKKLEQENKVRNINDLRQIALAVLMYAGDHDGAFPPNLTELKAGNYLNPGKVYLWQDPVSGKQEEEYLYCPKLSGDEENPSLVVLAAAPQPHEGKREVVFVDGHADLIAEDEFRRLARRQKWQIPGIKHDPVPAKLRHQILALIEKLGARDYKIRRQAKDDLAAMGEKAVPVLEEFRQASDPEVRLAVLELLEGK